MSIFELPGLMVICSPIRERLKTGSIIDLIAVKSEDELPTSVGNESQWSSWVTHIHERRRWTQGEWRHEIDAKRSCIWKETIVVFPKYIRCGGEGKQKQSIKRGSQLEPKCYHIIRWSPNTKTLVNKYTTRSGSSRLPSIYTSCLFIYNK